MVERFVEEDDHNIQVFLGLVLYCRENRDCEGILSVNATGQTVIIPRYVLLGIAG